MMTRRINPIAAAATAVAFAAPLVTPALADTTSYYTAPRMLKQGKSVTPISGDGKIVVKVLVNADGTFKVQSIISSTNHADDAAALEIAKTSTYAPATKGSTKQLAFYDYTLIFKDGGASSGADDAPVGELGQDERELRAQNWSGAQTALKTYVAAHPDDARAFLDLGIADTYLSAYDDASAAFDKAGTIPAADHSIAGKAYVEHAVALLNAKNTTDGLAAAKHAADFNPGFASDDTLGVAEMQNGDATSAVADLEKAHALGKSDANVPVASRVANDVHLVQAYLAAGNIDGATQTITEANGLDPKSAATTSLVMASYYATKAQAASKGGNPAAAAALYLQAAGTDTPQATLYYTNAAFAYLREKPADDAKAKDALDKAIAANPNDAAANYGEGIILADQGKKSDAAAAFSKADSLAKAAGNTDLSAAIEKAQAQLSGSDAM